MDTVRGWLEADLTAPREQRRTARRVWQRLLDEEGARVSESTIRALVRRTFGLMYDDAGGANKPSSTD